MFIYFLACIWKRFDLRRRRWLSVECEDTTLKQDMVLSLPKLCPWTDDPRKRLLSLHHDPWPSGKDSDLQLTSQTGNSRETHVCASCASSTQLSVMSLRSHNGLCGCLASQPVSSLKFWQPAVSGPHPFIEKTILLPNVQNLRIQRKCSQNRHEVAS